MRLVKFKVAYRRQLHLEIADRGQIIFFLRCAISIEAGQLHNVLFGFLSKSGLTALAADQDGVPCNLNSEWSPTP